MSPALPMLPPEDLGESRQRFSRRRDSAPPQGARVAGVLFLITFATSIPAALLLYHPVLKDHHYITGGGANTRVALGAFLEMILIAANIGYLGGQKFRLQR